MSSERWNGAKTCSHLRSFDNSSKCTKTRKLFETYKVRRDTFYGSGGRCGNAPRMICFLLRCRMAEVGDRSSSVLCIAGNFPLMCFLSLRVGYLHNELSDINVEQKHVWGFLYIAICKLFFKQFFCNVFRLFASIFLSLLLKFYCRSR